ncbi:MAG: selenocysteine-specific translation elongation factor [Alcaligenaceae bacterium]|nr:selenocysteine-specific translation elongation factor [Alcaligenaceae bacterium]
MIVGTAGHIDHGKTTLIRALTGVETDRLEEEKKRGISIQLGYAYTPLPNGDVLGFIDVPGHERLIRTMVSGATGIDYALMVIAADDGVMPQTREHLAILSILSITAGAVVITKSATVDEARLSQVKQEIRALVAGGFLDNAPVFVTNAIDENCPGVAQLREHLFKEAQERSSQKTEGLFRLSVDRVFTLTGQGTVVTGTVHSGELNLEVQAGDAAGEAIDLRHFPSASGVRVRSIHAQDQASKTGRAGQRCALNLGGIAKDEIERGDWIADARTFTPSFNIDVDLQLMSSSDQHIQAWTPLHLHIAAKHYHVHAVPLSMDRVEPGQSAKVQLVSEEPICSMTGDRFIIRNPQATQTIGGGRILHPNAPDRKRRSAERLAWLDGVLAFLNGAGLEVLLKQAPYGLSEQTLLRLTAKPLAKLEKPAPVLELVPSGSQAQKTWIMESHWQALAEQVTRRLIEFHEQSPDEVGVEILRLRRMTLPKLSDALWQLLVRYLLEQGLIARTRSLLHLPGHIPVLSEKEAALAEQILPLVAAGGANPPWVRDISKQLSAEEGDVRQVLRRLSRQGEIFQVVHDLFYHRQALQDLANIVLSLVPQDDIVTTDFRDASGLGRKRAVQILEYFDRVGLTRRVKERRLVRNNSLDWL